jgi:hypothetical protein
MKYKCQACGTPTDLKFGLCQSCEDRGLWIDPAGGIHAEEEDDPAAMYESKKLQESKFGRTLGRFNDFSSKVVVQLKRLGVDDSSNLDLQLIANCFLQDMTSRDCAQNYLKAHKKKNESKEIKKLKSILETIEKLQAKK